MKDYNIQALVKGDEKYILVFDDASVAEAMRQLGRWACEPLLSFTWHDAAVLSKRIRGQVERTDRERMLESLR
jgi:hypothetical protein